MNPKRQNPMNQAFLDAGKYVEWLSWLGMPMVYDGGLCVNRSPEEHEETMKHPQAKLMV